jgi:hypothetical protein
MAGDFSRKTFDPKKHYSGVLKQQGRVDLDADWNEELDILQYRTNTETKDVIGASGVPRKGGAFTITVPVDASNLLIAPGHMYAGGLLCENDEQGINYFNQPYYPNPDPGFFDVPPGSPPSPPNAILKDGTYIVYVDAWQREVNYLDDPHMHEVALGEADTATRLQNIWQVKLLKVADNANAVCKTPFTEWDALIAGSSGKLNAQTKKVVDPDNPCALPPRAGYQRLENQLYRVEVQKGGTLAQTTFKWSRENASVETIIESINGDILTVSDVGKDEVLGFAGGQWVEIVDEENTLKGTPPQLIKIVSVNPAIREITLSTSLIPNKNNGKLKLRRWDQSDISATADGLAASNAWIDIEDGLQVSFSAGTYSAGDYWLIPARTATGEIEWPPFLIPNLTPIAQSPSGIKHNYCRLALLQVNSGPSGKMVKVQDCRPKFPSLTEICADDICFDNNNCNLQQASNVQQALDLLCAANDLRAHNKYLHGFGVICGLKMKCHPLRTKLIIEKGQALDCDGNIIQLKNQNGQSYDLVNEAKIKNLLDIKGDGQLCISVTGGPNNTLAVSLEKFVPQKFWDTVLEGTLLKDFYEQCIQSLIDFFRQQFPIPLTDAVPVPVTQKRFTAFINLFAQLINSASGPYGFISGVSGTPQPGGLSAHPTEDELLRKFYDDLKEKLASETFCAMFDKDHPYPDYVIDKGLDTIFGLSFKTHMQLRLHPNSKFAYTCGKNNKVYVYDLGKKELIQSVDFPSGATIQLQDIAISDDGKKIYGAGIINTDSVFAVGDIVGNGLINWGAPSTKPGACLSLAFAKGNRLFGIMRQQGLVEIKGIGTGSFNVSILNQFNATGLMYFSNERNLVIAANNTNGGLQTQFNQLVIFTPGIGGFKATVAFTGDDAGNDISLLNDNFYVSGNNPSGKRVVRGYNINTGTQVNTEIEINNNSFVRLDIYSSQNTKVDNLLISLSDEFKVVKVKLDPNSFKIDQKFRIPVQLFPVDIIIDNKQGQGYVLNSVVNTITSMHMAEVFHNAPAPDYTMEPPVNLSSYRDDVITAYKDMLSHLLQYLKDCFCDKFIIDCPECGPEDKVYLGCVDIQDSKVYHICNFSKRRYVKSFRTVEYWLSTVPVLPIVKEAFTKFCCMVM